MPASEVEKNQALPSRGDCIHSELCLQLQKPPPRGEAKQRLLQACRVPWQLRWRCSQTSRKEGPRSPWNPEHARLCYSLIWTWVSVFRYWETSILSVLGSQDSLSLLLGSPAGQRDVSTSLEVPVPTLPSLCPSPESQESLLWLEQLRWSTYSWALWLEEQGHKTRSVLAVSTPRVRRSLEECCPCIACNGLLKFYFWARAQSTKTE